MAASRQTDFSTAFASIRNKSSSDIFRKGTIDNIPVLLQVISWRRTGKKLLPQPQMTRFKDCYVPSGLNVIITVSTLLITIVETLLVKISTQENYCFE